MTALARLAVPSEEAETKASDVLIHVRYTPSAEIFFIDALPAYTTPREWLDRLLAGASDYYQVLAGGAASSGFRARFSTRFRGSLPWRKLPNSGWTFSQVASESYGISSFAYPLPGCANGRDWF